MTASDSEPLVLRVVRGGEPTDEEVAALAAVLSARGGASGEPERPVRQPLNRWVARGLPRGEAWYRWGDAAY